MRKSAIGWFLSLVVSLPAVAADIPPPGNTMVVIGGGYRSPEWEDYITLTGRMPDAVALWQHDYALEGVEYQGGASPTEVALFMLFDAPWTDIHGILAGRRDAELKTLAIAVKNLSKPVYVDLMGEPDYQIERRPYTQDEFIQTYKYIHDLWSREGATNVTWIFHLACHANPSYNEIVSLYPGDEYVDLLGFSFYGVGNLEGAARLAAFGKMHRKPLVISESSATFAQSRSGIMHWNRFFNAYFGFIERYDVRLFHYNNIHHSDSSRGCPVDSFPHMSPEVRRGWAHQMHRPRYAHTH